MAPIPVHIGYWTAWVGPDGRVSYLDDPYGLDRTHERAVRRAARSR
jgi:murein L,D-transpeptidase YcbB/YkuD